VNGEQNRVFATAFCVRELDERTALIEGLFRDQELPSALRVMRSEITHVGPFSETLFRTMGALGLLDENGSMPKH
jgi:hypothetical protein